VDVDTVLRKEVDMDCVTPSHTSAIPAGESLDILQLLEKGEKAYLDPKIVPKDPPNPQRFVYQEREAVMTSLQQAEAPSYLKAQTTGEDGELRQIIKDLRFPSSAASTSTTKSKASSSASTSKPKPRGKQDKRTTNPYMQNPSLLMVEDNDVPFGRYAPTSFADWRGTSVGGGSSAGGVGGSSVGGGSTRQQDNKRKQEMNKAAVDENSYWTPSLVRKIPSAVGKVV
jgi:DNA polymerase gamma 1